VPIGYHKSEAVRSAADEMYDKLRDAGIDVLLDDREERPGVLFADMDLIGIPLRVVLGERGLAAGNAEVKARHEEKGADVPLASVARFLRERLTA
jgi:prolyl-tRNA synthetase